MRSVFTGFKFSPDLIVFGPWSGPGCDTVMYMEYLPSLCESPLVSVFSAIRMYATCAVLPSQGIAGFVPSEGHGGQVHRLSPPDPSAASMAAITRSVSAPDVRTNACTAFGTTSPGRRIFPWME